MMLCVAFRRCLWLFVAGCLLLVVVGALVHVVVAVFFVGGGLKAR